MASIDEPIDALDDARRALRKKLDAVTSASKTFRRRRAINDRETARALDELRSRILEIAAILQYLLAEAEVAELSQKIDDTERETVDGEPPAIPDPTLRDELAKLREVLLTTLQEIDDKRDPGNRVLPDAADSIECWARQRRGDTDPCDRVDLDGVDASVPSPPNPEEKK